MTEPFLHFLKLSLRNGVIAGSFDKFYVLDCIFETVCTVHMFPIKCRHGPSSSQTKVPARKQKTKSRSRLTAQGIVGRRYDGQVSSSLALHQSSFHIFVPAGSVMELTGKGADLILHPLN